MSVKMESSGFVKDEEDEVQPLQPMDDEDAFEDAGELEIPGQPQDTWLLRIPRMLHEQWAKLDQDAELTLGAVKRNKRTGQSILMLNASMPQHQSIPREYEIYVTEPKVSNTYVFSEGDLPGYKKGARHTKAAQSNDTALGPKGEGKVDKGRRFQRAIPKQTALKGVIRSEANCTAVDNADTRKIMKARADQEKAERPPMQYKEDARSAESMMFRANRMRAGVDKSGRGTTLKPRPQDNRTARMPRNELLDNLYECFSEYTFWSMKALKDRLRQPELYLKENLESIAELVRSGVQVGQYRLRPEAQRQNFSVNEEAAPEDSQLEDLTEGTDQEQNDENV